MRDADARTVASMLRLGIARLRACHRDGARLDATLLLAHVLARDPAWLLAHDDARIDDEAWARYDAALTRRERGEPIAYIVGAAGFYGRTFTVTPDVLVPRPETEGIVDELLALDLPDGDLCDVGTGSGALALTLAAERPGCRVTAIDVSPEAIAVARVNAERVAVADRVTFVIGDGLQAAPAGHVYAGIVANLPYVRSDELAPAPHPTSFEPRCALDGGSDGLVIYRALLRDAPTRLAAGGVLVMEAGPGTVPPLACLAALAFGERTVSVRRDVAGRDRLVIVRP